MLRENLKNLKMGQAKKRRSCPAVSREITSAECGENRLSRYACPESCPFNPFSAAGYAALLEAEEALDLTSVKRLAGEDAVVTDAFFEARRLNADHGWQAAIVWHLFFKRDGNGRSFGERWQVAGFPGLKNDEQVFFRGKMQMRVALLEVHRILDEQRIEAVDLLEPTAPPRIYVDWSVAASAVRFTTMLTWIYPLPHFWRISGMGITMADLGPFSPVEMLDACRAHLGGPAGAEAQREWLAENFVRIHEALVATGLERRRQMLAGLDGSFGAATYELRASFQKCRKVLLADPAIEVDEISGEERKKGFGEAMVWFEPAPTGGTAPATSLGRRVLGRVLLGLSEWRVEALGGLRLDQLRERFEARLGDRVRFLKERRDDFAGQIASREPAADLALVPPRLLERPGSFDISSSRLASPATGGSTAEFQAQMINEQVRGWLDEPLPALEGRTARAAAPLPAWRPRVIELVKALVRQCDQQNLETGRADDINGLIRELGLGEIDFPPPPARPPVGEDAHDVDRFEDGRDDDPGELPDPPRRSPPGGGAGWSAPPVSDRPLTADEAIERLEAGRRAFERAADAIEEIEDSGSTLLEDAAALAEGQMDERDFGTLTVFLIQIWFALVPRGGRAPRLRLPAMSAALGRDAEKLATGGSKAEAVLQRLLADSPQPYLLQVVAGTAMGLIEKGPKAVRPAPGSVVGMILVMKVVLAEIDHALRED